MARGEETLPAVPRRFLRCPSCHPALATNIEVFVCVASVILPLQCSKSTVFPLMAHCFRSDVGAQEADGSALYREWGIEQRHGVSLCSRLTLLRLLLLFDPNGAQGGAVWLGWAGIRAQWAGRVVTGATEAAFKGRGGERPRLVVQAEGARAEVTERRGRGATDAAVVPWAFPTSCTQAETQLKRMLKPHAGSLMCHNE